MVRDLDGSAMVLPPSSSTPTLGRTGGSRSRAWQQHHPEATSSAVYKLDMSPVHHTPPSISQRPPSASLDTSQPVPSHRCAPSRPGASGSYQHYLVWPRGDCINSGGGATEARTPPRGCCSPGSSSTTGSHLASPLHSCRSTPRSQQSLLEGESGQLHPQRGRVTDENAAQGALSKALQPLLIYEGQPVEVKAAHEMELLARENARLLGEQQRVGKREEEIQRQTAENGDPPRTQPTGTAPARDHEALQ